MKELKDLLFKAALESKRDLEEMKRISKKHNLKNSINSETAVYATLLALIEDSGLKSEYNEWKKLTDRRRRTMSSETLCKIFYCDRRRKNACCADCENYHKCNNHCLNTPEKCSGAYTGISQAKCNLFTVKAICSRYTCRRGGTCYGVNTGWYSGSP